MADEPLIDPGTAPEPEDVERELEREEELGQAAAIGREEAPAVSEDQVAEVFDFAASLLNMAATARGGGPEDVYTFTPKELDLLGRAGASYVNRHARLAAIAEKSDVIVIGGVTFKMLKRETGRYRAHAAAQDGRLDSLENEIRPPGAVRVDLP